MRGLRSAAAGFTLVEVLVAASLGAMLSIALVAFTRQTVDARDRADVLLAAIQTSRHIADRVDRLLAEADPGTMTWDESDDLWLEADVPVAGAGTERIRLEWIPDGTTRVLETRGGTTAILSDAVGLLAFAPVTATRRGVRFVREVRVTLAVRVRVGAGEPPFELWRQWHAPLWRGLER